jgi:hypothetical protein
MIHELKVTVRPDQDIKAIVSGFGYYRAPDHMSGYTKHGPAEIITTSVYVDSIKNFEEMQKDVAKERWAQRNNRETETES